MPGLSAKEWLLNFPNQPFPIVRRVDRGFPARYEEFLQKHRFDIDLLNRLGAGQGFDEHLLQRIYQELNDSQWWPIADFLPFETDKFGRKDKLIDGHNCHPIVACSDMPTKPSGRRKFMESNAASIPLTRMYVME